MKEVLDLSPIADLSYQNNMPKGIEVVSGFRFSAPPQNTCMEGQKGNKECGTKDQVEVSWRKMME